MRAPKHSGSSTLQRLAYLTFACLALSSQGTEFRVAEHRLIAREKTEPAKAYLFQKSSDLVHWQSVDSLRKGDGTSIEIAIPLPGSDQEKTFLRVRQTEIWAPLEIDTEFIKKLGEYNEADGKIDFVPTAENQIVMTLDTIEDGQHLDSSIYSTISWTLDENDFNHATFTLTIDKVVYRSPFSATYTIQQMADISGQDVPHRIVSDLYYTGKDEGSYSTKFYMLSGVLDEQTDGSIGDLFP